MLSHEVLRRVLAKADQASRVAACLSASSVHEAAVHPSVWRRVTVYDPASPSVLAFLRRVRPESLRVVHGDVACVEALLRGVAAVGAGQQVTALTVDLVGSCAVPSACALLDCAAEFAALEALAVSAQDVAAPACLAFQPDTTLPRLRALKVEERPPTARPLRLELYLAGAALPELEAVDARVATCDVLAHAPRFPRLRSVAYRGDVESYEDARLDGLRLDSLALHVRGELAMHFLEAALSSARYVDEVALSLHVPARLESFVNMRCLRLTACQPGLEVGLQLAAVRGLRSVTVDAPHAHRFTVRFCGAGSWHNFQTWQQRTAFHVGVGGCVVVDP